MEQRQQVISLRHGVDDQVHTYNQLFLKMKLKNEVLRGVFQVTNGYFSITGTFLLEYYYDENGFHDIYKYRQPIVLYRTNFTFELSPEYGLPNEAKLKLPC